MLCAPLRIISKFVNVSQVFQETQRKSANQLTIAKVPLVVLEQLARTTEVRSNVSVRQDTLETLTPLDVRRLSSVKSTMTVPKPQSVFKRMEFLSVETFVKASHVDPTLNVNLKTTLASVCAVTAMMEILRIESMDVNPSQAHVKPTLTVHRTRTAMD